MNIFWKDKKTRELFENIENLKKSGLDKKEIKKVFMALQNMGATESVNLLPRNMNFHSIKSGKRFLYFAVDIPSIGGGRGKNRIIFKPPDDSEFDLANLSTVKSIEVLGIQDYH